MNLRVSTNILTQPPKTETYEGFQDLDISYQANVTDHVIYSFPNVIFNTLVKNVPFINAWHPSVCLSPS